VSNISSRTIVGHVGEKIINNIKADGSGMLRNESTLFWKFCICPAVWAVILPVFTMQ
jgi:hypothetical protein